ncbi:MAG: enoyl-CoA hydratase-related protein [Fimbriimonadaceae bacterium]
MLIVERQGSVLFVRLNRPDVRNAFNEELIAALTQTFASVGEDVRAVVLSGEGSAFCAGGDLDYMRRMGESSYEENLADARRLGMLFESVRECRVPVVARIQGAAFGGGLGLAAASDIAVAADDVRFSFSEVRLGLVPGTLSPVVVPKIGAGHARALFATGEVFGAEHALRIGLVHEVVPLAELDEAVERKLGAILAGGPNSVAGAKRLVLDQPLDREQCARRIAAARASDEGLEGLRAFLEKRRASFVESRSPGG